MTEPVLQVRGLRVVFETFEGSYSALNSVDVTINEGEIVGLVGESGCGKSSLALAVMGLLPSPPAKIVSGNILFKGNDLLSYTEKQMEEVRGTGISMIFQEPLTSLNPLFTIGDQVSEAIRIRLRRNGQKAGRNREPEIKAQVASWLRRVELADPENALERYPHEWSGGMRQRVMIAMALAAKPALMLADEPTSAVDVTTQAQILRLVRSLVSEVKTSILFISHDLAVVAQIADRVAVMYTGTIVEEAPVNEIFENPLHPYTNALLSSFPKEEKTPRTRFEIIPGSVPNLAHIPQGCPFRPRCKFAREECAIMKPDLRETLSGHRVACILC